MTNNRTDLEALAVRQWPDAIDEYRAFSGWWQRTVQTDVPGVTSHYFDAWMAAARRQAELRA